MAGPVYPLRLVLLAALLGPAARAQTAAATVRAPVATESAASPKLTKLIGGPPPKYESPKTGTGAPASLRPTPDRPRNGIIRLPTYVVRGAARPPDEYEILTPKGHDAAMAQRYLGPQSNLDRVLNGVTLTGLWKSIPVLGKVPFVPFASMTYDERAAFIYEKPEKKRRFNELMSIEQAAPKPEEAKPADQPAK